MKSHLYRVLVSNCMAQRKSKIANRSLDTQQSVYVENHTVWQNLRTCSKTQPGQSPPQNLRRSKRKWTDKPLHIQTSLFSTSSIKHSGKASKLLTKLPLAHSPSRPSETMGKVYNCLPSKSGMTQSSKTAENSIISEEEGESNVFDLSSPSKRIVVGMARSLFTHQRNWHWAAAMAIGRLILGLRHRYRPQ